MAPTPKPGSSILYRLHAADVEKINLDRAEAGVQGNPVHVGDELPAIVVKSFSHPYLNAQVILDGPDTLWVTSRCWGQEPGTWAWVDPIDEHAARVNAGLEF